MSDLLKTILTSFLLALIAAGTKAQVAKKPATTVDSSAAERGAKLAETGHCAEAMPLLKKSFPLTTDKVLKLKLGFDSVRCELTLNQPYFEVHFLTFPNSYIPPIHPL